MMMYVEGIQNQYELTIVVKPIVISHGTVERMEGLDGYQHGERAGFINKETLPHYTTHLPCNFDLQPFVNV